MKAEELRRRASEERSVKPEEAQPEEKRAASAEPAPAQLERPVSAEAWANRTCVLHAINREELLALMNRDRTISVELLWSFVHTLSDRLRETNSKVTFLAAAGRF